MTWCFQNYLIIHSIKFKLLKERSKDFLFAHLFLYWGENEYRLQHKFCKHINQELLLTLCTLELKIISLNSSM